MQTESTFDNAPLDLREYLGILQLRKWMMLLVTALVVGGALFVSYRQTPLYQSEAKVLVKALPPRASASSIYSIPNLETERELALSQTVARLAEDKLDAAGEPDDGRGELSVSVATETEILLLKVDHPSPVMAQLQAQAYADSYLEFRRDEVVQDMLASSEAVRQQIQGLNVQLDALNRRIQEVIGTARATTLQTQANSIVGRIAILQQQLTDLTPPERLRVGQIVEQADLPASPVTPNHLTNGLLGLIAGLTLGIGAVFLRERLDDRLRGRADLESRVGAPVLSVVPTVSNWRKRKQAVLVTLDEPRSAASEAYRTLRTGVLFAAAQGRAKTILVTSAQAGEGKTASTANLGVALSQANKRIILVSADLRKPRLSNFFDMNKEPGLSNVLQGEVGLAEALKDPGIENLRVLPSGSIPHDPAELLGSEAMLRTLEQLAQAADFVLIDGPPILALADAITLAPLADGLLFIADAQNTGRSAVDHARQQLDQVNARLIGCILNNFDPSKAGGYQYQYRYYYSDRYGETGPALLAAPSSEPIEPDIAATGRSGRRRSSNPR